MSKKHTGGRGKRAPYQTAVIRVPVALVPIFEQIQCQYLDQVMRQDETAVDAEAFLQEAILRVLDNPVVTRKKKIRVLSGGRS